MCLVLRHVMPINQWLESNRVARFYFSGRGGRGEGGGEGNSEAQ